MTYPHTSGMRLAVWLFMHLYSVNFYKAIVVGWGNKVKANTWSLLSQFPGSQGDLLSVMRGHSADRTALFCGSLGLGELRGRRGKIWLEEWGRRHGEGGVRSRPWRMGRFSMVKKHSGSRNNVVKAWFKSRALKYPGWTSKGVRTEYSKPLTYEWVHFREQVRKSNRVSLGTQQTQLAIYYCTLTGL